jgi:hypothetical protein
MAMAYSPGQGATALHRAVDAGELSRTDLVDFILFEWTWNDSPADAANEGDWVRIFRLVGFFSRGSQQVRDRPRDPVTLYRGAVPERARRMSWSESQDLAQELGKRHTFDGARAAIYQAVIDPTDILAYLWRPGEGWTVVVDPGGIPDDPTIVGWIDPRSPE